MNYLIQHIASASDPSPTYFHIHFSEHNYSGCRKLFFACVSRWRNISKSPTASLCLFLCFSMLFLFSSSLPLGCNKTLPEKAASFFLLPVSSRPYSSAGSPLFPPQAVSRLNKDATFSAALK